MLFSLFRLDSYKAKTRKETVLFGPAMLCILI